MSSEATWVAQSGQQSVVLASFESHRRAERMLVSLGRGFRRKAREGGVTAVLIAGNADGSLRLTQSRVLTASGFSNALFRMSLAWMVGFMGLLSALKGARTGAHAAGVRKGHVGSDEHQAHRILAEAGSRAVIMLVRCKDTTARKLVTAGAAERARYSWDGSLAEFLAALDPGSAHDWVRSAVGESNTRRRH
ncbi:hypothetical protein [Streptomyces sp. NPDC060022]|uniref:hypothetical protein n=1 Tax=Streptomyces sp. NPDC060022 TaxID=3347039 RepID=UPI0036B44255